MTLELVSLTIEDLNQTTVMMTVGLNMKRKKGFPIKESSLKKFRKRKTWLKRIKRRILCKQEYKHNVATLEAGNDDEELWNAPYRETLFSEDYSLWRCLTRVAMLVV